MIPGNYHISGNVYDVSAVRGAVQIDNEAIAANERKYSEVSEEPFAVRVNLDNEKAADAYKSVLKYAGASHRRDAVDRRIVKEVKAGKATFKGSVNGFPGIIDNENDVLK
jgi:hypothetical protein